MRVISLNTNGLRAAIRKGFYEWLPEQDADFVCLQEIKARPEQLAKAEFDPEGRYIEARLGNLSVASVYIPSGSGSEIRLAAKFRFMEELAEHLAGLAASGRDCLICGDWNVAHKEIDLTNFKANRKRPGFLPEECAWLDKVFGPIGFVDTFREVNKEGGQYTWWSNRHPTTRERNVGWRLDYQAATRRLATCVRTVEVSTDKRFSDHAPLVFDYAVRGHARPPKPF